MAVRFLHFLHIECQRQSSAAWKRGADPCACKGRDVLCDRHGSRLAGASPVMALGRREHVGEGKGARRNPQLHLMEEGSSRMGPGGGQ